MARRIGNRLGGHTWIFPVAAGIGVFALNRMIAKRSTARALTSSVGFAMAIAGLFAAEPIVEEAAAAAQFPEI